MGAIFSHNYTELYRTPKSGKRKKGLCFWVFVYFLTIIIIMMLASESKTEVPMKKLV